MFNKTTLNKLKADNTLLVRNRSNSLLLVVDDYLMYDRSNPMYDDFDSYYISLSVYDHDLVDYDYDGRSIDYVYRAYDKNVDISNRYNIAKYGLIYDRYKSPMYNSYLNAKYYINKFRYKFNSYFNKKKQKEYLDSITFGVDNLPDWFLDRLSDRTIITSYADECRNIESYYCDIYSKDGSQKRANYGDILIYLPNDTIDVCKDSIKFNKKYKRIP